MAKKITELNEATRLNSNDLLVVVQDGETKNIKGEKFIGSYSLDEVNTGKKWIDGKDIWRITLYTTSQSTSLGINIDSRVSINAFRTASEYYGYVECSQDIVVQTSAIWIIGETFNRLSSGVTITIEYTKQ